MQYNASLEDFPVATETQNHPPVSFETSPDQYHHWKLEIDEPIARLSLDVQEDEGLRPGYQLKLNSYDLGVDIELQDAIQRLRFEHPGASLEAVDPLSIPCVGQR